MEKLRSAINWFEIPSTNFDRAVRFYGEIYALEMHTHEMGQLRMGFFQHEQGVGTGVAVVFGDDRAPSRDGSKLYLNAGEDLNVVLNRVDNAGGRIVQGKTQISPEIGYFALIEDTEGNHIYLHSMN